MVSQEVLVQWSPVVGSLSAGLATAWIGSWLIRSARTDVAGSTNHYESERRGWLRQRSWVYRTFEQRTRSLSEMLDQNWDSPESRLQHALIATSDLRNWTAREFMAVKIIEGLMVGLAVAVFVSITGSWPLMLLAGVLMAALYPFLIRQSLLSQAESRLKRQRIRLPFVIDQIALMMQAGASFEESLRSIADEEPDHPLTEELRVVLGDITAGRTRRDALGDLKERIPDREFGELFFSIIKGEELGTPLSTILSEQAEQMRIKRSQWGEKAAAEAEVQIVFPGMLVMIACLIVVLGPIMLPAVMNLFGTEN